MSCQGQTIHSTFCAAAHMGPTPEHTSPLRPCSSQPSQTEGDNDTGSLPDLTDTASSGSSDPDEDPSNEASLSAPITQCPQPPAPSAAGPPGSGGTKTPNASMTAPAHTPNRGPKLPPRPVRTAQQPLATAAPAPTSMHAAAGTGAAGSRQDAAGAGTGAGPAAHAWVGGMPAALLSVIEEQQMEAERLELVEMGRSGWVSGTA